MSLVVLFIDMWPDQLPAGEIRERFQDLPPCAHQYGCDIQIQHHLQLDVQGLAEQPPAAIMISGSMLNLVDNPAEDPTNGTTLDRFIDVTNLLSRLPQVPTLGICFGHQFLAKAGGGKLEKMQERRSENHVAVSFIEPHPLLNGIPTPARFVENHAWRVAQPAQGYRVIGTSHDGIEMVVHQKLPRIGVQFHPEYFMRQDPGLRHGELFLANYFRSLSNSASA